MKVIITNINWDFNFETITDEVAKGILSAIEVFEEANAEMKLLPDEVAIFLPSSATTSLD